MNMIKVMRSIIGVLAAAALALSCAAPFDPPAGASVSEGAGLVVLTVSTEGGSARTVRPTAVPVFSRYALVFSRAGSTDITINNAADLDGEGVSRELEAGTWTATVTAYQTFTVTGGTAEEYPAARGSAAIPVQAGETTRKTVDLAPIPVTEDSLKGIFTYKVTFPTEAEGTISLGGEAPVALASGVEVSVEKAPGYYDIAILISRGSLSAGLMEKAHIYAGLESKAEYSFTEANFAGTAYLAGTLTLDGGATPVSGTVTAYADQGYATQIGQTSVIGNDGSWLIGIAASRTGAAVYFKAEAEGSDGKNYSAAGNSGQAVTGTGKQGIALTGVAHKAATPVANPGTGEVEAGTTVVLSTATAGADIYYTTDGTDPDNTKTKYTASIAINAAVTIKAIAIKAGMTNSDILTAAYTIALDPPTGIVEVRFTGLPADETITLSGVQDLSWVANTALNASVGGTFSSYRWALDGAVIPGQTGSSLTLEAGDLLIKRHTLTVLATKNGVEYAKNVTFTVTQ